MTPKGLFESADLIYAYTREQALDDGVLVDVSEMAREAGIRYPVAVTASVWATIEAIPEKLKGVQDVQGRLWDVLSMFRFAARMARVDGDTLFYDLHMDRNEGGRRVRKLRLKAVCGPGDNWEPVVTIMLPDED